jgi:hypothetical protein
MLILYEEEDGDDDECHYYGTSIGQHCSCDDTNFEERRRRIVPKKPGPLLVS